MARADNGIHRIGGQVIMRELKVYKMVDKYYCDDSFCVEPSDVYLKSEVDEAIAELKDVIRKHEAKNKWRSPIDEKPE